MNEDDKASHWSRTIKDQISNLKTKTPGINKLTVDSLRDVLFHLMRDQQVIAYGLDSKGELLFLEGSVEAITGYDPQELLAQNLNWQGLIFPEDLPKYQNFYQQANKHKVAPLSYRIINRAGQICWLSESIILPTTKDSDLALAGLIVNITKQHENEQKYLQRQAQLDSILNSVQDVIWSITPDTFKFIYINPATTKVYGYKPDDLLAEKYPEFSEAQAAIILDHYIELLYKGEFEAEYSYVRPDGEQTWIHKRAYFARDAYGVVARIDGIDTDITIRKKTQDAMRYMSEHDALTNLYNRAYFEKEIQRLEQEKERMVGLIICDVDGLKLVNDNWGHEAGDKLLMQCAAILRACFPHNTIARIGGDEFAIIMENYLIDEVASAVTNINRALLIYNRNQPRLPVSMSVGWSVRSANCSRMHEVFREADNRMYASKLGNRVKYNRVFDELNSNNSAKKD